MRPSSWKATWLVALKELRSSFRDRQTVLYTVVLPIALYPALLWCLVQGALLVQGRDENTPVVVGLAAEGELPPGLRAALEADGGKGLFVEPATRPLSEGEARAWMQAERAPDAVLWVSSPGRECGSKLFFESTEHRSSLARSRVEDEVEPFALELRRGAALALGRDPEELVPFEIQVANVAPAKDMLGYVLSFLLPLLLVVMCVMGAFFPAVDLTAGEKERRTSETTLLLPVPRLSVHQGKILAVCVSAVLASALNLTALGFSVGHLLSMLAQGEASHLGGFPLLALLAVAPLALLFSFFVSAVLVGVAALARSFEEGQALLGPVQILFILPALSGVIPGIELSLPLCFVPVVNVALAFRSMLLGQILPGEYALVALSLLLYGLLATRLAVRLLSRESLFLGSFRPSRPWSALRSSAHAS